MGSRATETSISVPRRVLGGGAQDATCPAPDPSSGTPVGNVPGPSPWQAQASLSRGTGAGWLHPGVYPGFSSSRCLPLRWQRGMTQGHTPSGVTQIQRQPLLQAQPPRPAIGGTGTGSRRGGGNPPVVSHLPQPRPAGHHVRHPGPKAQSLNFAPHLTGSSQRPRKFLTLQTRVPSGPVPTHPGEHSVGTFLHQLR